MRILVTGGAGYIGSHTVRKLLSSGHEVVVYDDLSSGFSEAVPSGVKFVIGDVRNKILLSHVLREEKICAVIHFAAKNIVPESLAQPLSYYENNTAGVISLASACVEAKVDKVVFSSTAAVYGEVGCIEKTSESIVPMPRHPYGASKLMSERILRDCEQPFGLRSVCLRYFNVAGAAIDGTNGQRTLNTTHLIKVVSEVACGKRDAISIFGTDYPTEDGTGVRDFIHVEDLADLHVLALGYLASGGKSDIFNCGYGRGYSVRQVVDTVCKVSGQPVQTIEQPRRVGDPAQVVADSAKIRSAFSWTPKYDDLELICRTAYEWEKKLSAST